MTNTSHAPAFTAPTTIGQSTHSPFFVAPVVRSRASADDRSRRSTAVFRLGREGTDPASRGRYPVGDAR